VSKKSTNLSVPKSVEKYKFDNIEEFSQRLAEICSQYISMDGYSRTEDESDLQYINRILPMISSSISGRNRLTAFQADLYNLKINALESIYNELGHTDEEKKVFSDLEKSDMVVELDRLYLENPGETRRSFIKRLFASQTTVQQYYIHQIPDVEQAKTFFKRNLRRDIFKGETPTSLGSKYQITHGTHLRENGSVYAISLAKAQRAQEYLTRDYYIVESISQEVAHVIINPEAKIVEVRAPVDVAGKALNEIFDVLRVNNLSTMPYKIPIDELDIEFLKRELPAGLIDTEVQNAESISGGGRTISFKGDRRYTGKNGKRDVSDSPNYRDFNKAVKGMTASADLSKKEVLLCYEPANAKPTHFRINTEKSSIRFTEGEADDEVIQHVLRKLNANRLSREKTGEVIIKSHWKLSEKDRISHQDKLKKDAQKKKSEEKK
jgi:hypothetical protein